MKLAIKYPKTAFDSVWNLFYAAVSGQGKDGYMSTRNCINGSGDTRILEKTEYGAGLQWQMVNSKLKNPFNRESRAKFMTSLSGLNSEDKITITHKIIWNLFIPLGLSILALIYTLVKRKWFMFFLLATVLIRVPIVFATAPAQYFMYYLSTYLCCYVLSFVNILEIINDIKNKPKKVKE